MSIKSKEGPNKYGQDNFFSIIYVFEYIVRVKLLRQNQNYVQIRNNGCIHHKQVCSADCLP